MDRVIDLDEAATVIADRRATWEAAGLVVEPVTWRDGAAPWPQRLETDRSRTQDPDSVGVHLHNALGDGARRDAELLVVLYRGGWADIDYLVDAEDAGVLPSPALRSAQEFGALLDACVARVFGDGAEDPTRRTATPGTAGPVGSRGE
ncbi:hypothetical protein [Streptomyces sp. NPDC012510]|uniref:hypothetical protein n=1 Tax=Streptomyces sp. NPDC012510 TaxID=3364838 RepID=UPI0036EF393C